MNSARPSRAEALEIAAELFQELILEHLEFHVETYEMDSGFEGIVVTLSGAVSSDDVRRILAFEDSRPVHVSFPVREREIVRIRIISRGEEQ